MFNSFYNGDEFICQRSTMVVSTLVYDMRSKKGESTTAVMDSLGLLFILYCTVTVTVFLYFPAFTVIIT